MMLIIAKEAPKEEPKEEDMDMGDLFAFWFRIIKKIAKFN